MTESELARLQSELVAALVLGVPGPQRVDANQLAAAREQLLDKRAGVVAGVWPELALACGRSWSAWFAAWASERPTVGARRDGYRFAHWLALLPASAGALPTERIPRLDSLQVSAIATLLLSWQERDDTLVARRGLRRVRVGGRTFRAWR